MTEHNTNFIHISREELYDLYWKQCKSLSYIANHVLYCSHVTVLNRMKEYNIPTRRKGKGKSECPKDTE